MDTLVNKVYYCELNGIPRIYSNFGTALVGIYEVSGQKSFGDMPDLKLRNIVVDATAAGAREAGLKIYNLVFDRKKKMQAIKELPIEKDDDLIFITNEANYAYALRCDGPYLISGIVARDQFSAILLAKQELDRIIDFFNAEGKKKKL